jgi:membrane-associated phospholipid phosphatase
VLAACLVSASARAQNAQTRPTNAGIAPPLWRPAWRDFSWIEGATTVSAGAATLVLALHRPPDEPRWRGGILFDDPVRRSLRLSSPDARATARRIGDWPYYMAGIMPLLADPIVAWLAHDDAHAAVNAELMALEAFSYAGLLSFVSTRISVRERPDTTECRRQSADGAACERDTEAFWSGHTTIVAASAGIVCANHRAMPLWGSAAADVSACVASSSAALVTAISRLAADRHYATDVLVGFSVGFGFGFGVPTLLHYGRASLPVTVAVQPVPSGGALLSLAGAL